MKRSDTASGAPSRAAGPDTPARPEIAPPPQADRRINPSRTFTVPAEVKHLDSLQLSALTECFRAWAGASDRPATQSSRSRVWMIYLLLRYTGAKLGEVLALDDRTDLDLDRSVVRFVRPVAEQGGEQAEEAAPREVQIPPEVVRELALRLDDPAFLPLRGTLLRMDGGYIRRKFYERAAECALPKELANPRVLRHSRAIELLRSGVPLPVVQAVLGHSTINLTAHYLSFSEQDIRAIVNHYIQKEARMKTSARNSFTGQVTSVRTGQIISEVVLKTIAGLEVVSVVTNESLDKLGIKEGQTLTATIKAPQVVVVKEPGDRKTSMRNRYRGVINRINTGMIAAEVVIGLPDGTEVVALITDESVKKLGIKVGDTAWGMFKAFAVVLNAE